MAFGRSSLFQHICKYFKAIRQLGSVSRCFRFSLLIQTILHGNLVTHTSIKYIWGITAITYKIDSVSRDDVS